MSRVHICVVQHGPLLEPGLESGSVARCRKVVFLPRVSFTYHDRPAETYSQQALQVRQRYKAVVRLLYPRELGSAPSASGVFKQVAGSHSLVFALPDPAKTRFQSSFWLPAAAFGFGLGHPRSMCPGIAAICRTAPQIGHSPSSGCQLDQWRSNSSPDSASSTTSSSP